MANISKELFDASIRPEDTCRLLHPWSDSCVVGICTTLRKSGTGVLKFFLPIYVAQTFLMKMRGRKLSKWFLVRSFARSILYGHAFVLMFFSSVCLFRGVLGEFKYYTMVAMPAFVGGLSVLLESEDNRNLNALYFYNLLIEAYVKYLEYYDYIKRSRLKDTATFMLCSSALMYLLKTHRTKPYNNLWFYPVKPKSTDCSASSRCTHDGSCTSFARTGFSSYFLVGYVIEIVKFFMSRAKHLPRRPKLLSTMLFGKENFLLGLVTGLYVASYRGLTCLLYRKDCGERDHHAAVAGLLSGASFFIKPNLQFGIIAFSTVLQLLVQRALRFRELPRASSGLCFALCSALLMHNHIMLEDTCPAYIRNMISNCTNGLDQVLKRGVLQLIVDRM